MQSSKPNGSPHPELTTKTSSSSSSASVSNVYAAGESVSSDATRPPPIPPRSPARVDPTRTLRRGRNSSAESHASSVGKRSWFSRKGTWPKVGQKSVAITKLATENASSESLNNPPSPTDERFVSEEDSITIASSVATIKNQPEQKVQKKKSEGAMPLYPKRSNNSSLSLPLLGRGNGVALSAATTPENIPEPPPKIATSETTPAEPTEEPVNETPSQLEPTELSAPDPQTAEQARGWLGWWYTQPQITAAPEFANIKIAEAETPNEPEPAPIIREEPQHPPAQFIPNHEERVGATIPTLHTDSVTDGHAQAEDTQSVTSSSVRPKSWFALWGSLPEVHTVPTVKEEVKETHIPPTPTPDESEDVSTIQPLATEQEVAQNQIPVAPNKSYGWSFWSRGTDAVSTIEKGTQEEIAVAAINDVTESATQKATTKPSKSDSTLQEGVRPSTPISVSSKAATQKATNSKDANSKKSDTGSLNGPATPMGPKVAPMSSPPTTESSAQKIPQKSLPQKNHLLPAFETCYSVPEQPSIIKSLTGPLVKYWKNPQPTNKKHLHLLRQTPRPKKAVAIGVHGFFPMRLVRTVLGEPKGTSIRFANHAALSIKRWAEKNDIEIEVEKIALEGEGKVGDRVDMLWKLLQNWMDHVRSADFVLMAAHSQGVVVGMQLLAKLIEEGCVDNARIGFTAMAGINLGPFGHLPTTLLTGSARELFEFQKQDSTVSKKYIQAMRIVLAHNVRILYVGSIDDQLVPMESSLITSIHHPYIYRAVFVDGRVHAPDFLSHLVGFAMKLRNLGISDHGLIRELSTPLAGSLYGGEGHSRIYDDGAVYDLGVRHALETADCEGVPLRVDPFELSTNNNPYFLPWSLRGMLEENHVRTHLAGECFQLLEQYENWKPNSKTLRDVKFRLEGIRSKL